MTATTGAGRKPQKRGGETIRRVLDAARDLMLEGGFDAVQLAAVSERSGVSTGSLYHHFGSKSGIITRLVDEFVTTALADLHALDLAAKPFDARVKAVTDLTCAQFRDNGELYRSMSQYMSVDPDVWEKLRSLRVHFEHRMLSECAADLAQRGIADPPAAIHRMFQVMLGVLTHSVLFDSGPVRPTDANLETEVFAIGHAILLLPAPKDQTS